MAATGSLREAQKALTRARIIDAAETVFQTHGYAGASIGLITTEAAINRATFYLHFPDKLAVFREVIAHDRLHTDEHWRELNTALMIGTRDAVVDWVEHLTQWARDNAGLIAARHEAMAGEPEFAREFRPRYDRLAVEISEYLQTIPAAEREDVKIRVQLLAVMLDQMLFHVVIQQVWDGPPDQVLRLLADICCKALAIGDWAR